MVIWLVILSSLTAATLIALIVGIVIMTRKLGVAVHEVAAAARDAAESFRAIQQAVEPTAVDVRSTLANFDGLVTSARREVESVSRITGSIERLTEGRVIADAAGKAVATSRSKVVAVLEGLREGLRALRAAREHETEESNDG